MSESRLWPRPLRIFTVNNSAKSFIYEPKRKEKKLRIDFDTVGAEGDKSQARCRHHTTLFAVSCNRLIKQSQKHNWSLNYSNFTLSITFINWHVKIPENHSLIIFETFKNNSYSNVLHFWKKLFKFLIRSWFALSSVKYVL